MGNVSSSDENPPVTLAIMAVARECRLEKRQIVALRNAMAGFSNQRGMIDRGGFDKALVLANLASVEILDLLFTMWDNARDGLVPFKEFCVGISLIACPNDEIPAILGFALHVGDIMNRGYLGAESLCNLLSGINLTTSYFGDAHLSPAEIHAVVDAVFESGEIEVITHEGKQDMFVFFSVFLRVFSMYSLIFPAARPHNSLHQETILKSVHKEIRFGKEQSTGKIQERLGH